VRVDPEIHSSTGILDALAEKSDIPSATRNEPLQPTFFVSDSPSVATLRNRNTEPGAIGTVFSLISFGVTAITTVATFFGVGFLLLAHPREEMPAIRMRPHEATPTPPKLTPPDNSALSAAAVALPMRPSSVATHAQPAAGKGTDEPKRDARLRFLRQQLARLELQLTKPGRSAAETSRIERQKAYWGRAIERMLASP